MYKEPLATADCTCPPFGAVTPQDTVGYRLVMNIPVTNNDFKSHAALGKRKPRDVDDCSWLSCSLFDSPAKLLNVKGLPKISGKWKGIVCVKLDSSAGPIKANTTGHIHWWPYTAFDIMQKCTVEVELP
jgi:hypothetical protein